MEERSQQVYGKILLFGEYSVLVQGKALTIPLTHYSGRLRLPEGIPSPGQSESNSLLQEYYEFLVSQKQQSKFPFIDFTSFRKDLQAGLYFASDIPQGYGAGSSGALVAAVYRRYAADGQDGHAEPDPEILQKKLAMLEAYFHGSSSGIDPMSCYLGVPLEFSQGEGIRRVQIPQEYFTVGSGFFLLDTGFPRKTGDMVKIFNKNYRDQVFRQMMHTHYKTTVNNCIDSLKEGKLQELELYIQQLSELQYRFFELMIPDSIIDLWATGLHTGAFTFKLCGAGGGGFILGYTADFSNLSTFVKNLPIVRIAF